MTKEKPRMSYDLIHQVYQRERQSALLTRVDKEFYEDVAGLIKDLREGYDAEAAKSPTSAKAMLLQDELRKAQMLVREIYEYRIRKIALLALTEASEGSVERKHLVGREVAIFDRLTQTLKGGYGEIMKVEQGVIAISEDGEGGGVPVPSAPTRDAVEEEAEEAPRKKVSAPKAEVKGKVKERAEGKEGAAPAPDGMKAPSDEGAPVTKRIKLVAVQILEDLPKFLGEGGEVYSLRKKDYASLPLPLAQRLEKEGKARIMPT